MEKVGNSNYKKECICLEAVEELNKNRRCYPEHQLLPEVKSSRLTELIRVKDINDENI